MPQIYGTTKNYKCFTSEKKLSSIKIHTLAIWGHIHSMMAITVLREISVLIMDGAKYLFDNFLSVLHLK